MTTEEKIDLLCELAVFTTHERQGYENRQQVVRHRELVQKLRNEFPPNSVCRSHRLTTEECEALTSEQMAALVAD